MTRKTTRPSSDEINALLQGEKIRQITLEPPKEIRICNASSKEPLVLTEPVLREGANDHKKYKSRGF